MLTLILMACGDPPACDTAAPRDADGDGVVCTEDCDDTRPEVHPGAAEACDGLDRDCDGELLTPGICGGDQGIEDIGEEVPTENAWLGALGDDVVGAEGPDYFVGTHDGERALLIDGTIAPRALDPEYDDWSAEFTTSSGSGVVINSVADLNGDGENDLAFVDSLYLTGAHVHFGPFRQGFSRDVHDDDLTWPPVGVSDDGEWLQSWSFEDLDGQSGDELLGAELGGDAVLTVWSVQTPTVPIIRLYAPPGGERRKEASGDIGDLDGDGVDEVVVSVMVPATEGQILQLQSLSGGDISAAGDGATTDSLSLWTIDSNREDEVGDVVGTGSLRSAGDMDEDGVPDLLVSAKYSIRPDIGSGEDLVLPGTVRGSVDLKGDVRMSFVTQRDCDFFGSLSAGAGEGGPSTPVVDFDGDGAPDLMYDDCEGSGIAPLRADGILTPLTGLRFDTTTWLMDAADLNQDGADDILVLDQDTGLRYMLFGWPVPWDESQWW